MNIHSLPASSVSGAPAGEPSRGRGAQMNPFNSLAGVMRLSGALTVVAALSAFLLQGWASGNDLHRYYLLLAQTGLLAVGGFALSYGLKENKGARVFFGLSLLSVTANMVTLGALIFSIAHWGSLGHYPAFASWQAPTIGAMGLAAGIGLLALTPVALFSFMVLSRRSAYALAGLFLFANLLPLVPVRESGWAGMLAMLGVLVPLHGASRLLARDATLRTPEGYFALATLFAPALIMVIRSLCFYQMDALLQLLLAATGFAMMRIISQAVKNASVQLAAGLFSLALAGPAAHALAQIVGGGSEHLFYATFGAAFTALGLDVTRQSRRNRDIFALLTGSVLALTPLLLLVTVNDTASVLLFILAGIAVAWMGRTFAQRTLLVCGAGMAALGIAYELCHIIASINFSSWAALAILGAATIVAASVIERHGVAIKLRCERLLAGKY